MESPLHAIARYEQERGLPPNSINRVVAAAGETGAWARLERGELTVATFCAPFEADCRAHGVVVDGDTGGVLRSKPSPRSAGSACRPSAATIRSTTEHRGDVPRGSKGRTDA